MHPAEPRLRAEEIQGNVIPGFNTEGVRLIGLDISHERRARAWLGDRVREVDHERDVTTLAAVHHWRRSTADDDHVLGRPWLNLCFSYPGLQRLGCPGFRFEAIRDTWFKRGAIAVAGSLGDRDARDWPQAHALAILADNDHDRLNERCAALIVEAERRGFRERYVESGTRRPDSREHFGFRDGVSVPTVRGTVRAGVPLAARRPAGTPLADLYSDAGKLLLWPGQAVFGYPGQSRVSAIEPGATVRGGRSWMIDGSFLVFRKLQQDVEAFHAFAREAAWRLSVAGHDVSPDRVEAMLVGRWQNGSPLAQHPHEPGAYDAPGANDFRYFAATPSHEFSDSAGALVQVPASPADPDGRRCPYIAHIRKVNPRDAPTDLAGEPMAVALQPFRRGIPYGEPGDGERGLLFLAYTTAIDERFGALSRGWASLGVAPEPPSLAPDAIAGGVRHVEFLLDGERVPVPAPRPFVEAVGGGFFFAPSIHTLTELARCR